MHSPDTCNAGLLLVVIDRDAWDASMEITRPHVQPTKQFAHVEQATGDQMAHAIDRLPLSIDAKQLGFQ
jgi:hypothetical protein